MPVVCSFWYVASLPRLLQHTCPAKAQAAVFSRSQVSKPLDVIGPEFQIFHSGPRVMTKR